MSWTTLLGDVPEAHRTSASSLDVGLVQVGNRSHLCDNERVSLLVVDNLDALHPLQDYAEIVLRQLDYLQNPGGAADCVEIAVGRVLRARLALRQNPDHGAFLAYRFFDEADALLAANVDRNDASGEEHGVAQR
jgi:hypothetical protein